LGEKSTAVKSRLNGMIGLLFLLQSLS
jgi:hypothetical protein